MKALEGQVAVVAGATRGAGRGIARALGEAGAVVYCTGRSVPGQPSPYARPETIDETAALITAAGGTAIPVRVDHTIEREVEELFARVQGERGRLDVLVNSIAGEDPLMREWGSFWEVDLGKGEAILRQATLSHVITAKYAARLMVAARRGLLDAERRAFERFTGVTGVYPLNPRITPFVVHDLRYTAPIGRLRRFALGILVCHGPSMTDGRPPVFDIANIPACWNCSL
jgi:NAD(P)-dependent dehydrogenase (short-subunit alcohol dehydrogenase family)